MKGKLIMAALLAASLLLYPSCRFDSPVDVCYSRQEENWSDVFTNWWLAMNENYAFWFLDSPGQQWDEVYDTYLPLFQEMGSIGRYDKKKTTLALKYFYEIIIGAGNMEDPVAKSDFKGLSDMHYTFYLTVDGLPYSLSPRSRIKASQFNVSPDDFFCMVLNGETSDSKIEYDVENIYSIYQEYFPISGDGIYEEKDFTEISGHEVFEKAYLMCQSDMAMFLGLTKDKIAYIAFGQFMMTALEGNEQFKLMMDKFEEILSDSNGLIIDLRGNVGGYTADQNILFGPLLTAEKKYFAEERTKSGENRLDYTAWIPRYVSGHASKDYSKPIAVLINSASISMAEISSQIARALRDYYGFDTAIIGTTSSGGYGTLTNDSANTVGAGTIAVSDMVSLIYTPFFNHRYRNGICYEGKGEPVDIEVPFNYENFITGKDDKLDAALDWIRSFSQT